ncbi:coiled-coil domain-containing protein 171-like [Ammospiza caudacuta]|uniref:coiled-coil domain-containing protein 171-like n=1 Tax=Ammospiza caudacuta TaxID=2857398 RepID=UPI0027396941|nr:coiled-coil domain-containing protein 171-like [Ammospiza caudacuta]
MLEGEHHRDSSRTPMSRYEKEILQLRLELEKGELLRQNLESEMKFARKEANLQLCSAEDELCDAKTKVMELQVINDRHQQKASEIDKIAQSDQWQLQAEQQRCAVERDNIHRVHLAELEFLIREKAEAEMAFQKTNAALQSIAKKLKDMEAEHNGCAKVLRLQANSLEIKNKRQERLLKELEAAAVKIKELEDDAAAARLAHVECKYTTDVMQLRIQELEDILNEDQRGRRQALPEGVAREDFREPVNALETGKKASPRQHITYGMEWKDKVEAMRRAQDPSATLVVPPDSFSLHEGSIREMSILLNLYQTLANAQVLSRQTNVPLEELPWTELCALLHENVEALVSNFNKANQRISHLEYICKHKTDTMNDLQQNQEDALEKMSEQLKAQEHWSQKEKQYLEQQYSNALAEIHARSQECEETVQKNRQKLYGLEQLSDKLAQENNTLKNSLLDAFKARSFLLAASALLSGALCSLYGRLCAMSCQRDILQEQVNQQQLLNHKIVSLLYALPAVMERNQDEVRIRQRRAKSLAYVFRRAVIVALAANRLRGLARYSCTFFVWSDGCRGSPGIQVCLGESRGRHPVTRFGEEGVDCIEAINWLCSSNLYTAMINSISDLEGVLSNQDSELWLSSNSLIGTARNCFAKLMDNLSVLMETVQGNTRGCRAFLERDSLIDRLARGLRRLNAQALEAGLHDRLPSTRNIATLQQEIFEFSRRLHAAEVESRSLNLQLAECRWAFNKMQKDAEKTHRLQTQLSEVQQNINKDNVQEELQNALQREHEAQLLLQEHHQRIQELSNRLESHAFSELSKSQVSPTGLPDAAEELRKRDQALDQQEKLLKEMEQDQKRLWDTLEEAERALDQGIKDKELIIGQMKAVEAALNKNPRKFTLHLDQLLHLLLLLLLLLLQTPFSVAFHPKQLEDLVLLFLLLQTPFNVAFHPKQLEDLVLLFLLLQDIELGLKGKGDASGLSGSRPKGGKPETGVKSAAQLSCKYTNTRSTGYKQELEAMVKQQSYDVIAITEMWWHDSHGWSAALDGYKFFRRDRKGRRGGGVALYIREAFDTMAIESYEVECLQIYFGLDHPVHLLFLFQFLQQLIDLQARLLLMLQFLLSFLLLLLGLVLVLVLGLVLLQLTDLQLLLVLPQFLLLVLVLVRVLALVLLHSGDAQDSEPLLCLKPTQTTVV